MASDLKKTLEFISKSEQLKKEMRHSWLSNNRRESVAEHTWRMSLMAILLREHLENPIDLEKVLKMIIIHDLVEIEAGDVSALKTLNDSSLRKEKTKKEIKAIKNIQKELQGELGNEIYNLWNEFEEKKSPEARFANAIDKLEVQIQHNHAPLETWEEIEFDMVYLMDEYVSYDPNLEEFKDLVVNQAEEKIGQREKNN